MKRWFLLIFVCLVYVVLGLQGLDMTDEGWVLSGYQQIYEAPESVSYLFLYYNAIAVGGIWQLLLGHWGILGFRILSALCITATVALVYQLLRKEVSYTALFIGIIVVILCNNYGTIVFHHNLFSALLTTAAAWMLINGLDRDSRKRVWIGGMLLGINYFTRIPNLALTSLLALLLVHARFNNSRVSGTSQPSTPSTWKMLLSALLGIGSGCLLVLTYLFAVGHLSLFIDNLAVGFSATESADSTHNLSYLLGISLTNFQCMGQQLLYTAFPLMLWKEQDFICLVYALVTIGLCFLMVWHRQEKRTLYSTLAALLIMYTQPLGSDFAIQNMGVYSIWIALPLFCQFIAELWQRLSRARWAWTRWVLLAWGLLVITPFLYRNAQALTFNCYNDPGPRYRKTYRIHHPLATIYTSQAYQQGIDSLLARLQPYIHENDTLLCFQHTPMVHYLTHTRPYLANPWVWTYDSSRFDILLKETARRNGLPHYILCDKGQLGYWHMPNPDWNNDQAPEDYVHKNGRIHTMKTFIAQNHYTVVWENDCFVLMATKQ